MGRHALPKPVRRAAPAIAAGAFLVVGAALAITPDDSGATYADWALMSLSGGGKDCKDFSSHEDAVAYFHYRGYSASYDPEHLDEDHDGNPCELLSHDPSYKNHWVTVTVPTTVAATSTASPAPSRETPTIATTSAPRKHTRYDVPK